MKRKIKKHLMFIVAVCLFAVCFIFNAAAEESGNFMYDILEDGTAEITGIIEEQESIVIPAEVDGIPVKSIGYRAFSIGYRLTEITISDGIEKIGDDAFYSTEITDIILPDSVTYIGDGAFSSCRYLKNVKLSNNLKYIGSRAFASTVSLETIILPDSLEEIGSLAFERSAIKTIIIPSGVKTIPVECFRESSLEEVTVSDGVEKIDDMAFYETELTAIALPDSVTYIGNQAFLRCMSLKSVELSSNLGYIGSEVFAYCVSLKKITLPDSLAEIAVSAFAKSSIKAINIPSGVEIIPTDCFEGSNLKEITIPETVKEIQSGAFSNCIYLKKVTFLGDIEKIADRTFNNCHTLEVINIPDSVTAIGESAFEQCNKLKLSKLPANLKTVSKYAFRNCWSLAEEIIFPDKVEKIGAYAFEGCPVLEKVDLNNVTTVGLCAFKAHNKYLQIIAGTSLKKIYKGAFVADGGVIYFCYRGTEAQWKKIGINISLDKVHFNYTDDHNVGHVVVKATLEENGRHIIKCDKCDFEYFVQSIYRPFVFTLLQPEYVYDGTVKNPEVTVLDWSYAPLEKGKNYTVKYEKGRKDTGRYNVKIIFKGDYSGEKTLKFTIAPKATSKLTAVQSISAIKLTWKKVTGADGYRIYQYNTKTKKWDTVKTITSGSAVSYKVSGLKSGTVYKFKIKAYKKDDGTIWGKDSTVLTTATKPAIPTLKLTSKNGKAVANWTNVSGESGYQLYYATKKDGEFKKVKSYGADVVKGAKSGLTVGKTYYFKVRAFKKVDGKVIYGSWSNVKAVKIIK